MRIFLNNKGFTLIELMVVMAVASIIMGTSVPLITKVMGKMQASNTISTFKKIEAKAKEYYNSLYPSPAWPTDITQILPSGAVNKNNWGYPWNIAVNGSNLEISTQVPTEWEAGVKNGLPAPFVSSSAGIVTYTIESPGQTADLTSINNRLTALENRPAISTGTIAMWANTLASIPSGWQLCDGSGGTPDLRDRFVYGVSTGENPGTIGGAHTYYLSTSQLPSHTHTISTDGSHTHRTRLYPGGGSGDGYWTDNIAASKYYDWNWSWFNVTSSDGSHNHGGATGSTGSGSTIDNRPAYYKVAFICKQ